MRYFCGVRTHRNYRNSILGLKIKFSHPGQNIFCPASRPFAHPTLISNNWSFSRGHTGDVFQNLIFTNFRNQFWDQPILILQRYQSFSGRVSKSNLWIQTQIFRFEIRQMIGRDELETNPLTNTPYSYKMICEPKFGFFSRILFESTDSGYFIPDFKPDSNRGEYQIHKKRFWINFDEFQFNQSHLNHLMYHF